MRYGHTVGLVALIATLVVPSGSGWAAAAPTGHRAGSVQGAKQVVAAVADETLGPGLWSRPDSSHSTVRIRAEVEVRGYYHRAFVSTGESPLSRRGYFRHRRSRLIVESARKGHFWGRLGLAAQPEAGEGKRVLTGDKRYFGTNLVVDLDEAFVEAALGPAKLRFGRQYVQLGLSPDYALVVDDYDFTADDHAEAIHNALRADVVWPGALCTTGLISRTRQGLDKPYGGDPVPYGSRTLLAAQIAYRWRAERALALYVATDHNVVDVPCDRLYRGASAFLQDAHWTLYAEVAQMTRQRPDGRLDRGWAWYVHGEQRLRFLGQRWRFVFRHAAFSSDNPRTRGVDETFVSAFNHFRLGESLDHRKTDGKSVFEIRLGWIPNRRPEVEVATYLDLREPFARHPLVRRSYPRPAYDWTGDELGVLVSLRTAEGSLWAGFSVYRPHTRLHFDGYGRNPTEVLALFGMNVFLGGK